MDAKTLRELMIDRGLSVKEGSENFRLLALERTLKLIINTKNQSDRTCLRNISKWLKDKFQSGQFDIEEIPSRVIDYALEATNPECRNHWAVFMHILKKELGYPK
jgi:phage-related protein